jgi:hypothetical protein
LVAGNYIDHKCPFTGNVSIRGRILAGKVRALRLSDQLRRSMCFPDRNPRQPKPCWARGCMGDEQEGTSRGRGGRAGSRPAAALCSVRQLRQWRLADSS